MGELDLPEESNEKKGFKGQCGKHSVGTMDGARSDVCSSVTRAFEMQIGKQHGLAMKKLVERGEETVYAEGPYRKKKKRGREKGEIITLKNDLRKADFCILNSSLTKLVQYIYILAIEAQPCECSRKLTSGSG